MFSPTLDQSACGILLPGKAVRHCCGCPPTVTVLVVDGSKICPTNICEPSQGLSTGVVTPLMVCVRGAPSKSEKSPCRSSAVGTVLVITAPCVWRNCSHPKKKCVLSLPLYNLGIHTGPPSVNP